MSKYSYSALPFNRFAVNQFRVKTNSYTQADVVSRAQPTYTTFFNSIFYKAFCNVIVEGAFIISAGDLWPFRPQL